MAEAKNKRASHRQLGQFMTPPELAKRVLETVSLSKEDVVLEPSFGDGSFIVALIDRFMRLYRGATSERLAKVLQRNIYGVEIDPSLYRSCLKKIESAYGALPSQHNLIQADFFEVEYPLRPFTRIVGNPPFGGTIAAHLHDGLDRRLGKWNGFKLKKETYSFFIARCLELLQDGGVLAFISSDTFLTIKTMMGLRHRLMDECAVEVKRLVAFSDQTTQPTLVLYATFGFPKSDALIDGVVVPRANMELTENFSWQIDSEFVPYFQGPTLGDFVVATSGMTTGNNELFVRNVDSNGILLEPYKFEFFKDKITVEREVEKARLNSVSSRKLEELKRLEKEGATRRNLRVTKRATPNRIQLPHPDYAYYNKSLSGIIYSPPRHAIFWKDDGDAVITYKKNGNWYLHGVGGQPYFKREGITWQLIAPRLNARYLPAGHILDSGAPCAFLRAEVDQDELWVILGWMLTSKCSDILKTVINHTRNIQSKDVERLPYPFWLEESNREKAIDLVQRMVRDAQEGRYFKRVDGEFQMLEEIYQYV